jgi:hypothetical protein
MSSKISICSNALQELGDAPIASFAASEGDRATLCGNLWPQVRDKILRAHLWPCTRKRVILAPEATTPAFDWAYSFLLPGDWLRTLQVGKRGYFIRFEPMGRSLLADVNALPLVYVAKADDPAQWDSTLVDLVGLEMQARLAYAVTQSASLAQMKRQEADQALKVAKSISGQDSEPEDWGDSPFTDVRY